MTDSQRLSVAVPCTLCKRSTKNASHQCSNHRNVNVGDTLYLDRTTVLRNNNVLTGRALKSQGDADRREIEQRNLDFITHAPVVTSEGHAAVIDEAFTLGSTVKDDGTEILTDLYGMEVTQRGRLIRQDNRLIIEVGSRAASEDYARDIAQSLWSETISSYDIECETYIDTAQVVSQFELYDDIDYRETRDGKLKAIFKDEETGSRHGVLFTPKQSEYQQIAEDRASGTRLDRMTEEDHARNASRLAEMQFITDMVHDCATRNEDGTISIPVGWSEI